MSATVLSTAGSTSALSVALILNDVARGQGRANAVAAENLDNASATPIIQDTNRVIIMFMISYWDVARMRPEWPHCNEHDEVYTRYICLNCFLLKYFYTAQSSLQAARYERRRILVTLYAVIFYVDVQVESLSLPDKWEMIHRLKPHPTFLDGRVSIQRRTNKQL